MTSEVLNFPPKEPIKRKATNSRPRQPKRCKKVPELQLNAYKSQVYKLPIIHHPLSLNTALPPQNLPSISQLEPVNSSHLDLSQEPISSAICYGFQQPSSFYCPLPQIAELNDPFSQQSMLDYTSSFYSLQPSQQTADDTQDSEPDLFSYFNFG